LVSAPVELTAAPALGAIPLAFLRNQAQYCSVICPFIVQGLVTVPVGTVLSPVAFLDSLTTTGSLTRAVGAAAASITGPANAAAEGIILNDVDRVVPKAFNNLEIAVVQLLRVGAALSNPADLPNAIDTARQTILDGLNQPLPGPGVPVPTETGAQTLPEVVAVEAIKVAAAVAFQAGELVLLGVVQTADAGAQELARSGDPVRAIAAAVTQAGDVLETASKIVNDSVQTAATNIHDALGAPVNTRIAATKSDATTADGTTDSKSDATVKDDGPTKPGQATVDATSKSDPTRTDSATKVDSTTTPAKKSTATRPRPVRQAVADLTRVVKALTGSSASADKPQKSVSDKDSGNTNDSAKTTHKHHAKSGKHAA
jgi:hypothetical protein